MYINPKKYKKYIFLYFIFQFLEKNKLTFSNLLNIYYDINSNT